MLRCPLTSNATITSDSACWEKFRDLYCPGWLLVENRVCKPFGADCEIYNNNSWCSGNDYATYWNVTPNVLVDQCVENYEPWVSGVHRYHYKKALDLLLNITVLHILLWAMMALAVYSYKRYKKEHYETEPGTPGIVMTNVSTVNGAS